MTRRAGDEPTEDGRDESDDVTFTEDGGDVHDVDQYDDEPVRPAPRTLGWLLTIGGFFGFFASFMLVAERIATLQNPNYMPTCNVDAVLQCGTVMGSDQGELFGFPNPLIGLAAFPIVILAGILTLVRTELPSWFWRWLLVGSAYALAFVGWLISQSLYEIRALCPYCMVVWACVIPIFWRTLTYSLAGGHFGQPIAQNALVRALERYWWALVALTYLPVLILVLTAFPYYFF